MIKLTHVIGGIVTPVEEVGGMIDDSTHTQKVSKFDFG